MPKRCRDETSAPAPLVAGACGGCRAAAPPPRARPARARRMFFAHRFAGRDTTVRVCSAYLGEIAIPCYDYGNGSVGLQATVPGAASPRCW